MKRIILAISLLGTTLISQASVGVAWGSNKWASDGMPILSETEQVKVFVCHGKTKEMSGEQAESCALEKCKRFFKIDLNIKESKVDDELIGNHCKRNGWSEIKNSYNIAAVGKRGDNRFLFSKSIGDKDLEESMKFLKSNNFPVNSNNIVFDIFDTGENGKDTLESAFAEKYQKIKGSNKPEIPGKPTIVKK